MSDPESVPLLGHLRLGILQNSLKLACAGHWDPRGSVPSWGFGLTRNVRLASVSLFIVFGRFCFWGKVGESPHSGFAACPPCTPANAQFRRDLPRFPMDALKAKSAGRRFNLPAARNRRRRGCRPNHLNHPDSSPLCLQPPVHPHTSVDISDPTCSAAIYHRSSSMQHRAGTNGCTLLPS